MAMTVKTIKWKPMEMLAKESFALSNGDVLKNVHPKGSCEGYTCVIHNPSPHVMRLMPTAYTTFKGWDHPMITRVCEHGQGHPDPDSWAFAYKTTTFGKTGPYEMLKYHTSSCCKCCRPIPEGSYDVESYSLAYGWCNNGLPPLPTPQEFPMTDEIREKIVTLATTVSAVHGMKHSPVKYARDHGWAPKTEEHVLDVSEYTFANPVLVRYGLPQAPCFVHYRSGFTAAWGLTPVDGTATMSQNLTLEQFTAKVYKPIMDFTLLEAQV
jgi:hypothetical protein